MSKTKPLVQKHQFLNMDPGESQYKESPLQILIEKDVV